ncbi:MAG: SpoVA/SpoVAEb family sporulation membrane protein [Limnochordales bacterium]|nr:stage V sporulation protein AE [Bacillota bacterium]REJ33544.1 MAG: stage V sporulation protein AE [Bacillota bacterium]
MIYFWAFVVGGLICALMEYISLKFQQLTPGHLLVGLTVTGAIVNGFGLYDRLVEFAGAGALLPVSGFGAAITRGVMEEMRRLGWEGLLTGTLELVGLGIAAGVLFSTVAALVSAPRG